VTERELDRRVARRLAILRYHEEGHSVVLTCRRYGIARETYYEWQRRYLALGLEGLRDRSTRPHRCPFAISQEAIDKIIYLRQNYHFGPHKLGMYLKRYHQLEISVSGIWRVLRRHNLSRLPQSQRYKPHKERWKLYEKPRPGQCLQVDVKFISPIAGHRKRLYQYTAIDDCTRLRVLRIYERLNQKTAIQFIDLVLDRLPFKVETVQTDNGGEFQSSFHWHLRDRGIRHLYIKPFTPRLNGKVERSHRIDDDEFYRLLEGVVVDDTAILNAKLREWEHFYNFDRPHAALNGDTPYERLRQKTGLSVSAGTVS